jgi:hypothetical protein
MREDDWRSGDAGEPAWQAGDLLPGGRYRVERQMGSWGIRSLYAVADTMTDQPALLCVLSSAGAGEVAERVARLAALEHPFLPVIREYILRDDLLILILQVAGGTPMDTSLSASPGARVDERTAVGWGIQIANGLAFLHRQHPPLIVGDLAPSALLLTPYGRLKLLGLGPLLGLFTQAGLVGALEQGYAAPEIYSGRLDPLSDIYALGALLFQSVTGSHPEANVPGSLPAIRSLRPELSAELSDVIARAVAIEPEARWQSAAEFAEALRQVEVLLERRDAAANAPVAEALSHLAALLAGVDDTMPQPNLAPPADVLPGHATEPSHAESVQPSVAAPSMPPPQPAAPQAAPRGGLFGALGSLFRANTRMSPSAMSATGSVMLAKRMRPKREYPVLVRILGKPEDDVRAVSFAAGAQSAKTGLGKVKSGTRVTVEVAAVPDDAFRLPQPRVTMRAPKPGSVTEARIAVVALRPSPDAADRLQFTFRDEQGRALHPEPFVADVTIVEATAPAGASPSADMLTLAHAITVLV